MSNNQGFGLRSSSVSNMSAFKPFVPDVVPQQQQKQQQQQQYHLHNRHQRHYSQQEPNTCGQTPVGSGVVFQPITHPPSFCGSASTLPRGQSPDNGYLSLEHPSRTASFVSQISTQFSPSTGDLPRNIRGPPFDLAASPKEGQTPGRSQQQPLDSSSDSPNSTFASYRSSQSSVNSSAFNNSWTSKKSGSGFDFRSTPGRRQSEAERQNMYSTVLVGGHRNSGNPSGSDAKQPATPTGGPPSSGLHRDVPSISDIKSALMIKDTELRMMRETMTKNESAILQVFEDKKRKWQVEMSDRKKEWEGQLQALQKKAWKTEQLLQFQVAKLHQENKKLQTKAEELETEKKRLEDQCQALQTELNGLKSDMRGLLDDVSAKDLLDQFQSSKIDADRYKIDPDCCKVSNSSPSNSLVYPTRPPNGSDVGSGSTGRQMRRKYPTQETLHGLNRTSSELSLVKTDVRTLSLPELQRELENARREVEACRLELEQERQNWKAEKEKVIDYQKRLQLSYLQILHKNRLLELDVQQLTGEMAELDIRQLSRDEAVVPKAPQGETVY